MNFNSIPTVLGALALAGSMSIGAALAGDDANRSDETDVAINEEAQANERRAEQTNSCEEYGRESAGWTLNVAYNNDPRHTPCVSDTGTRIRSRSDD